MNSTGSMVPQGGWRLANYLSTKYPNFAQALTNQNLLSRLQSNLLGAPRYLVLVPAADNISQTCITGGNLGAQWNNNIAVLPPNIDVENASLTTLGGQTITLNGNSNSGNINGIAQWSAPPIELADGVIVLYTCPTRAALPVSTVANTVPAVACVCPTASYAWLWWIIIIVILLLILYWLYKSGYLNKLTNPSNSI